MTFLTSRCFGKMEEQPWLYTGTLPPVQGLPDYGYRLRFDHAFTRKCRPFWLPRLSQMPSLLGISMRYARLWCKMSLTGKKLFIDNFNMCPWRPIYGVPIGGIGCGTIGRGFRGEFCRFQLVPGLYRYNVVDADQFVVCLRKDGKTIYHQVLSPHTPKGNALSYWRWGFPADQAVYHGLYPRSWTVYNIEEFDVRLICRQISPVIPHDYKDASLPCAVFVWDVYNNGNENIDVSIMFTFKNGQGDPEDKLGGVTTSSFTSYGDKGSTVTGVAIHQTLNDMPCTCAIGAKEKSGCNVTFRTAFDPTSNGKELWQDLSYDGDLDSFEVGGEDPTRPGEEIACAVCCRSSVAAHSKTTIEFGLTWDMPIVHFGSKGIRYSRRYTRYYGMAGEAYHNLLLYALNSYAIWEEKIECWQRLALDSQFLPSWYKSALFNELYYISDGGTVWLDSLSQTNGYKVQETRDVAHPYQSKYGKFAYLEGQEYRMYNTYDVHHYASFALIMLWPELQLTLQYDIASLIPVEQTEQVTYLMNGEVDVVKSKNCIPHDLGNPDNEPWVELNAYRIHPTNEWKDLNTKFILEVYRDYVYTGNKQYLEDMYPFVKCLIEKCLRWDVDDDGVIDNAGFADQTYDAWPVSGASAYCGGMWLAALRMYIEMSKAVEHQEDLDKFTNILEKGKRAFQEKLWNGSYYNYDSSASSHHDSIMADQLAGQWYLKSCDVADYSVFPKDNIITACHSIYKHNVLPFRHGTMGAINGMRPDGRKDRTSIQSDEFWVGVNYSLAATMIQEGLLDRGWQVAYGAYHTCWETYGLAYQTPEGYFDDGRYRSLGYMRPLAIWSMQYALEKHHPKLLAASFDKEC